jgi:hypothetical protein
MGRPKDVSIRTTDWQMSPFSTISCRSSSKASVSECRDRSIPFLLLGELETTSLCSLSLISLPPYEEDAPLEYPGRTVHSFDRAQSRFRADMRRSGTSEEGSRTSSGRTCLLIFLLNDARLSFSGLPEFARVKPKTLASDLSRIPVRTETCCARYKKLKSKQYENLAYFSACHPHPRQQCFDGIPWFIKSSSDLSTTLVQRGHLRQCRADRPSSFLRLSLQKRSCSFELQKVMTRSVWPKLYVWRYIT